jgi:YVTN family beta-propeller protein
MLLLGGWISFAAEPGLLYVLDVASGTGVDGRILAVDPVTGSVRSTFATGYSPNFGICGDRLYVTDGAIGQGVLSTYDLETRSLVHAIPVPDRIVTTAPPSTPGVGCSNDGRWVFVANMRRPSGVDEYTLTVISTKTGNAAPQPIPVAGCGVASFTAWPFGGWDVAVRCPATNALQLIALADDGAVARSQVVELGWAPRTAPDGSIVPKAQRLVTNMVVTPARASLTVMRRGGGIEEVAAGDLSLRPNVADSWERWIPPGAAIASAATNMIYIGYGTPQERFGDGGRVSHIAVLGAADLIETAHMATSLPFASLAGSSDGSRLYAVNYANRSITVIDAATMQEIKVIPNVGNRPALAIAR